MIAIMLAVPAATAVLGTVPGAGTSEDQTSDGTSPIPTSSGFWVDGEIYEVIVTFSDPCVVERRLSLERGGMTDELDLAKYSRDHKAQLEEKHVSFMQYVWEKYPDVPLKLAVAASSAVPFVYQPVSHEGHWYVDGGVATGRAPRGGRASSR